MKEQFLNELRSRLKGLPKNEIDERISFYAEMIDDGIEEGLSEEEAVKRIGTVDSVVSQILSEVPFSKLVKEKIKPKRTLKVWEVALIVLGFPLWLPLLLVAFTLILVAYIVIWSLVIVAWSIEFSFIMATIGCLIGCIPIFIHGGALSGLSAMSLGLVSAGISILFFLVCIKICKVTINFTKKILVSLKNGFLNKE